MDNVFERSLSSEKVITVFLWHGLWVALGAIAAQRFTISPISAYICVFPLLGAIYTFKQNPALRNSLIILALFWSTDQAVPGTSSTHVILRYTIYFLAYLTLVQQTTIKINNLILILGLFSIYATLTILDPGSKNLSQLSRDVQISLLVLALISLRTSKPFELNFPVLVAGIVGYLVSEIVNFFSLADIWYGDYMSFDTTKFLIVLPSIYFLLRGRILYSVLLIIATFPVLVGYTTRTLFLAYLTALLVAVLVAVKRTAPKKSFALIIISIITLVVFQKLGIFKNFESFKALNQFTVIWQEGIRGFSTLDPVRYASSKIFFDLPTLNILLGKGFGSGIIDSDSNLGFVTSYQTAFSAQELTSNTYYNFHDVWVDIGLRFGLAPMFIFLIWFFKNNASAISANLSISLVTIVGFVSAFYGISGLMLTAMLIRYCTSESAQSN